MDWIHLLEISGSHGGEYEIFWDAAPFSLV
jgi:hypothetical protein